jgi:hypothetical protein
MQPGQGKERDVEKMKIPAEALAMALDAADAVRHMEKAANRALHENGDEASYRAGMVEKCRLLKELPEAVSDLLLEAEGAAADAFCQGLENFGRKASQAMSLGSVFYMSALLYPEDYSDGDLNDLESFLEGFASNPD